MRRSFGRTTHEISFGEIPPGGGDYDLVVPFSVEALMAASQDERLSRRNPLRFPTPEAIDLCDDKAALNERLRARGFARHVPTDAVVGSYPYMLKRRRDSCAQHAYRINGPADESTYAEQLASPDFLRQEWLDDRVEFTMHLIVAAGRVQQAVAIRFQMKDDQAIRGRDPVAALGRCRPQHVALFEAMLREVGFEGLCCVNYKLRDGVPVVMEINPRFGRSLAPHFFALVGGLEWERHPGQ